MLLIHKSIHMNIGIIMITTYKQIKELIYINEPQNGLLNGEVT